MHARENQYNGINAHLQSAYQNTSGWASFHNGYVREITVALDGILPAGYTVDMERSLQIREMLDTPRIHQVRPDVTVYSRDPEVGAQSQLTTATPTLVQPIEDTLATEDLYYPAVVIYRDADDPKGDPITRLEVISPTNKTHHRAIYIGKRDMALRAGINMVEIDLMHETRPLIPGIPHYPDDPNSYPYHITVSEPRPTLQRGQAKTYGFHVDMPVPVIAVPLLDDTVPLDLGAVYDTTFKSLSIYARMVDYTQLPQNFQRYSPRDQAAIQQLMATVQRRLNDEAT